MTEPELAGQLLDLTGTGFVLTDPQDDDPIVYVNDAFTALTGYARDDLLGRNCRLLQGPGTDPDAVAELRRAVRDEQPTVVVVRNYRRDARRSGTRCTSPRCATITATSWPSPASRPTSRPRASRSGATPHEQSARVAAESAERRAAFLAEASPLLDASLDLHSTLDSLTRLSVPYLGDVCIVGEIRHGEVRRLAATANDPAVERLVRALPSRYPVRPGDPLSRVLASGRPEIVAEAGADLFGPGAPAGPAGGRLSERRHDRARCGRAGGSSARWRSPRCAPTGATAARISRWPRTSPGGGAGA